MSGVDDTRLIMDLFHEVDDIKMRLTRIEGRNEKSRSSIGYLGVLGILAGMLVGVGAIMVAIALIVVFRKGVLP
jgi:tetrahydromethanopterin S-methyltransferase subunit F